MKGRKIRNRDIDILLKCAERMDRIATKYGLRGNLAQVYIEAYDQKMQEKRQRNGRTDQRPVKA